MHVELTSLFPPEAGGQGPRLLVVSAPCLEQRPTGGGATQKVRDGSGTETLNLAPDGHARIARAQGAVTPACPPSAERAAAASKQDSTAGHLRGKLPSTPTGRGLRAALRPTCRVTRQPRRLEPGHPAAPQPQRLESGHPAAPQLRPRHLEPGHPAAARPRRLEPRPPNKGSGSRASPQTLGVRVESCSGQQAGAPGAGSACWGLRYRKCLLG